MSTCCIDLAFGNTIRVSVTDLRDEITGDPIDDAQLGVTVYDTAGEELAAEFEWPLALVPQGGAAYLAVFDLPDVTGALVGLRVQAVVESLEDERRYRVVGWTVVRERPITCV